MAQPAKSKLTDPHASFVSQHSQESLGLGNVPLAPGEAPWRELGDPTKYMGKLYIDRRTGQRPDKAMILRALKIIIDQAPQKKARADVQFKSSSRVVNPPVLLGEDLDGSMLIRVPMLKIFSVGCKDKFFYYLTAAPHSKGVTRFWLFAYACKNREIAHNLSSDLISMCTLVRELRQDVLRRSNLSTTPLKKSGMGSAWSLLSTGSAASSTQVSPAGKGAAVSPRPAKTREQEARARQAHLGKLVDNINVDEAPRALLKKSIMTSAHATPTPLTNTYALDNTAILKERQLNNAGMLQRRVTATSIV